MMTGKCGIISGGERDTLSGIEDCGLIIACDKGYEYARAAGVRPGLLVGDFDSYTGPLPEDIPRLDLPAEKDDTDTMAAVRYAIAQGYGEIRIYCALGGRADHLLGNIQALSFCAERGVMASIVGGGCRIDVIKNSVISLEEQNGYFSVISLSDVSTVTIENAKYELSDARLTNSFPIGVSNRWKNGKARVKVKDGTAAVIRVKE